MTPPPPPLLDQRAVEVLGGSRVDKENSVQRGFLSVLGASASAWGGPQGLSTLEPSPRLVCREATTSAWKQLPKPADSP